jgi:hypothetical protein
MKLKGAVHPMFIALVAPVVNLGEDQAPRAAVGCYFSREFFSNSHATT